jgi:hypothetical protein
MLSSLKQVPDTLPLVHNNHIAGLKVQKKLGSFIIINEEEEQGKKLGLTVDIDSNSFLREHKRRTFDNSEMPISPISLARRTETFEEMVIRLADSTNDVKLPDKNKINMQSLPLISDSSLSNNINRKVENNFSSKSKHLHLSRSNKISNNTPFIEKDLKINEDMIYDDQTDYDTSTTTSISNNHARFCAGGKDLKNNKSGANSVDVMVELQRLYNIDPSKKEANIPRYAQNTVKSLIMTSVPTPAL